MVSAPKEDWHLISYERFNTTQDHAFNVWNALQYCRETGEDGLQFPKGTYDFYPDRAAERLLHVSNHDIYGEYRVAFPLCGMKHFTVDGGGSTFLFHGCIIPFLSEGSERITIENLTIDYPKILHLEGIVIARGEDSLDIRIQSLDDYEIEGEILYLTDESGNRQRFHYLFVRGHDNRLPYTPDARDTWSDGKQVRFTELGDRTVRMFHPAEMVDVGTNVTLRCDRMRQACNVVASDSKDLTVRNVTMLSSYAMGVLAQMTENVTLEHLTVKAKPGYLDSLEADATHFVHCKGLVKVTDCAFSEQLDDALNIHGVFTKIIEKTGDYLLIRYMHDEAKGLNLYRPGDTFQTLDPKSLIPNGTYRVARAEIINKDYTKLYVEGGTGAIREGDVVENLTWSCDLEFARNRVTNNRARGMLIAAKGKVRIHDNYFNTTGVAILFESDGQYWFESGGTNDVEITGNTFDHCKYVHTWGNNVIEVVPRAAFREGEYYHQSIRVTGNRFVGNDYPLLSADNVASVVFRDNRIEAQTGEPVVRFCRCGSVDCDV